MGCTCSRPRKSKATTSNGSPSQQQILVEGPAESNSSLSNDSSLTPLIEFPSLPRATEFYFQGPVRRQKFALPDSIMYYIAKNPSTAKLYLKMIQSCKYFFAVHPVIVISCHKNTKNGLKTCLINKDGYTKLDIDKISSKLWFCNKLHRGRECTETEDDDEKPDKPIELYIPKFYRYEIENGISFDSRTITFDQLFFFSNAKRLILEGTNITNENGKPVQIETIVANFPRLVEFVYFLDPNSSSISSNTVTELLKIPHFSKMKVFRMREVPDTFDIETFYKYLKERDNLSCVLEFRSTISEEYFDRLEMIVDELLATPESNSFPLLGLTFPNLNIEKHNELVKRFNENFARRNN